MKSITIIMVLAVTLLSCSCDSNVKKNISNEEGKSNRIVSFKGRHIDLQPYVEGFPYKDFNPSYAAGKLYYKKEGATTELLELDLKGKPDLTKGRKISDIDFSKRNAYGFKFNKNDKHIYWDGDEINDEVVNLYRLNPTTGKVEKLTDVPYMYGYRWNDAEKKVAYIARLGVKSEGVSELRILDLESMKETKIIQDKPEMRYSWGEPSWQPEGKGVVVTANKNSQRIYGNLVYIDFEKKTQATLTDETKTRNFGMLGMNGILKDWLDNNTFLFISNEDGFSNVYSFNISTKKTNQVTRFTTDIGAAELVTIKGTKYLFATTSSPVETQLYLMDIASGKIILQQKSDKMFTVNDTDGDKVLANASSNAVKFQIDEIKFTTDQFEIKTLVDLPADLQEKIYSAIPERVTYPTFDIDPATGKTRMLHAYLYKPKNPLPKKDQIVMIQSFYGGFNMYSEEYQIYANAGIYVFSPSPRGSFFLGKDFEALNNGDLGGNEIIDVIYAAKYISEKLGIPPQNIGVFGMSHGGYATMRTLTFPGEINGNKASFDWGFGIAVAGFSDIIHFYEHCNIPDWVTKEAGDPKTEAAKLKDRSPLYHADLLKGQLLLIHGTNDSRVPIAGSQMMADSLIKYNKPVTFVKFEGQGHGVVGLENNVRYYQTIFDFLEKATKKQ
jgi:dipeptidyl aminopeptidase/acylaminoacyl peptidase